MSMLAKSGQTSRQGIDVPPYSVLMSLYAGENPAWLRQSLVSMETQTIPPDEMVLVFDGSLPHALEDVVERFAIQAHFDVRVVRIAERRGTGVAVAQGMLVCRNELVARMDSDDIVTCDRMEKTLAAFAAHPELGIVGTQAVEFKGSPNNVTGIVVLPQSHDDIVAFSKRRIPFRQPSVTLRKSDVLAAGNYDGKFPFFEDYDLFNRMLACGSRAMNLPDICLFVRVGDSFYGRRGGRDYLAHIIKFKLAQYESGYFSAADLACSLPAHIVVCLMPNELRTQVYNTFLRKKVRPSSDSTDSPREPTRKSALLYTESWGIGGIEAGILNTAASLSAESIDISLFSVWKYDNAYDANLGQLDIRSHFLYEEQKSLAQRCLCGWKTFNQLLKQHDYDIVHVNTMNGAGLVYARIAKINDVDLVVAHAHNSSIGGKYKLIKNMFHHLGRVIGASAADTRIACSQKAGRHLFGNRDFTVIKQGIDLEEFAFDPAARVRIREQLDIRPETFVVGNVGRISPVKNPLFQIHVFAAFHQRVPDSVLLLVGDGELRQQRDSEIERLGLANSTRIIESTSNPSGFYSAMDCLILPSLFEGLPTVSIEAQTAGLPVIISDTITTETCITDLVRLCSLQKGVDDWADAIEELCRRGGQTNRSTYKREVEEAGFSREALHAKLVEVYGL